MFHINKQTSYALLDIANLIGETQYVPLSVLVRKTQMPRRFLARISSNLVSVGILSSKEGKTGGYMLAKPLQKISLYEFLKVFESDLELVQCQVSGVKCQFERICGHQHFFQNQLTDILVKNLKKYTLADVFKNSNPIRKN